MADVNALQLDTEEFSELTMAATVSGGDEVVPVSLSADLTIVFHNTAAGAVTAIITPAVTSGEDPSRGKWTKAAIQQSIPAADYFSFRIPGSQLSAYLNGSNKVPVTYTSHDVLLLIGAIQNA